MVLRKKRKSKTTTSRKRRRKISRKKISRKKTKGRRRRKISRKKTKRILTMDYPSQTQPMNFPPPPRPMNYPPPPPKTLQPTWKEYLNPLEKHQGTIIEKYKEDPERLHSELSKRFDPFDSLLNEASSSRVDRRRNVNKQSSDLHKPSHLLTPFREFDKQQEKVMSTKFQSKPKQIVSTEEKITSLNPFEKHQSTLIEKYKEDPERLHSELSKPFDPDTFDSLLNKASSSRVDR